jgi:hypothetical protein
MASTNISLSRGCLRRQQPPNLLSGALAQAIGRAYYVCSRKMRCDKKELSTRFAAVPLIEGTADRRDSSCRASWDGNLDYRTPAKCRLISPDQLQQVHLVAWERPGACANRN